MLSCYNCKTSKVKIVGKHPDFGATVFTCQNCGLSQVRTLPESLINDFYKSKYRESRDETANDDYVTNIGKRTDCQLSYIKEHVANVSSSLELGAGIGMLSHKVREHYRALRTDVTEPDVAFRNYIKNSYPEINVLDGDLASIIQKDEKYDLIMLSHVFEHLVDPVNVLGTLSRLLNKNGFIFIEVPNEDGVLLEKAVTHLKRGSGHLFYFNKETLGNTFQAVPSVELKNICIDGISKEDWAKGAKMDFFSSDKENGIWIRSILKKSNFAENNFVSTQPAYEDLTKDLFDSYINITDELAEKTRKFGIYKRKLQRAQKELKEFDYKSLKRKNKNLEKEIELKDRLLTTPSIGFALKLLLKSLKFKITKIRNT